MNGERPPKGPLDQAPETLAERAVNDLAPIAADEWPENWQPFRPAPLPDKPDNRTNHLEPASLFGKSVREAPRTTAGQNACARARG
jgi:hypothetical protein